MATFHDRTTAPRVQRGLLRAGRADGRVLTTSDTLTTIEAEFAGLIAQPWPAGVSVQSEPKLDVPNQPENFGLDADCSDTVTRGASRGDIPTPKVAEFGECKIAPNDLRNLAQARALHSRRELHKALEHGFALLDALGLGPAALDLIDDAIRDMDEFDGDADFEPWLGDAHFAEGISAFALDAEDDSEEDEGTALESHGSGFVRAGADDAEVDDAAEDDGAGELDDEHGSEDEAHPWRQHPASVVSAAQVANV